MLAMTDLLNDVRKAASKAKSQAPTTFDIKLPTPLRALAGYYQTESEYARWASSLTKDFLLGTGTAFVVERNPELAILTGLGKGGLEAVRYDYQAAKDRIARANATGTVSIHNPVRELLDIATMTPKELINEGGKYLREVVGIPISKAFNIAANENPFSQQLGWATTES
jgi:hypothetical protein